MASLWDMLDPTWQPVGGGVGLLPFGENKQGKLGWGIPGIVRQPLVELGKTWDDARAKSSGLLAGGYLSDGGDAYRPASNNTSAFDAVSLAPIGGIAAKAASQARGVPAMVAANSKEASAAPMLARALEQEGGPIRAYRGAGPDFATRGPVMSTSPDVASSYALDASRYGGDAGAVYPLDVQFSNPLDVDAGGRYWRQIPFEDGYQTSESLAALAKERGHDGLRIRNVADNAGEDWTAADTLFALQPGTVRSATTGELLFSNPDNAASVPMLTRALEETPRGITAYHGSPHDFDKFDLSKIGTGEGAQAYGHGLYFAENEGVARSYRQDGKTPSMRFPEPNAAAKYLAERSGWNGPIRYDPDSSAVYAVEKSGGLLSKKSERLLGNVMGRPGDHGISFAGEIDNPGRMYEVRINADPEQFLDWDRPLSQQSNEVRQWINDLPVKSRDAQRFQNEAMLGEDIVTELSRLYPEKQDASTMLREAGIPGIRYLDQGSRTSGEGSRNYVVFDDALVEILRKYGLIPGAYAGASLADMLTSADEPQY